MEKTGRAGGRKMEGIRMSQEETMVRLSADDYDEAIDFLNLVFSQASRPHDFEKMLPRMCVPDDEHMGKHFAVKAGGRIQAMLGVYPLPAAIDGRPFMFATVGNVATHIKARSRGCMTRLLDEAMLELERIGADAARLDGLRQRYGRYGFEKAGTRYTYTLTNRNVRACFGDLLSGDIRFTPIGAQDESLLARARDLAGQRAMAVDRGSLADFHKTLQAWQNQPWAAFDPDGRMIGYLTASADYASLAEQVADNPQRLVEMLCAWLTQRQLDSVSFSLAPWELDSCRTFNRICEQFAIQPATHLLIRNYAGLADALLAIQARQTRLPPGRVVIGIEDYGSLVLEVEQSHGRCRRSDEPGATQVDPLTATRLLFGPMPPSAVTRLPDDVSACLAAWLPLPMSWNGLDRV